jgi:BASS family bile acid:Na+ symporter
VNAATFVSLLNVAALVTMMLAMGLQVKFSAVTGSVRPVHQIALGLIANYVLVPAATVGLLILFQAEPLISTGFLILAVCPGAPVAPRAAELARGNVPWAIGMMVILAASSTLLSPILVGLLLGWMAPESDLQIDFLAIVRTLLVAQLIPLAVGLVVHHWLPKATSLIVKPIGLAGNAMLLLLMVVIVAAQYNTLAEIRLRGWTGMSLLFLASLAIGWLSGGTDLAIRKSLAVTTTARNAAVGLVIVSANFAGTAAVTAVVAYTILSIIGTFVCAAVLGKKWPT